MNGEWYQVADQLQTLKLLVQSGKLDYNAATKCVEMILKETIQGGK